MGNRGILAKAGIFLKLNQILAFSGMTFSLFLFMLSCGSADRGDNAASVGILERQSVSAEENGFLTTLELSSDVLQMKIRNVSSEERTLQYSPCEPRVAISRKNGGIVVWSTDGIACMALIQTSHIAPGKELTLTRKINSETVQQKGTYILEAELKTDPHLPMPPVPKKWEFEVR